MESTGRGIYTLTIPIENMSDIISNRRRKLGINSSIRIIGTNQGDSDVMALAAMVRSPLVANWAQPPVIAVADA